MDKSGAIHTGGQASTKASLSRMTGIQVTNVPGNRQFLYFHETLNTAARCPLPPRMSSCPPPSSPHTCNIYCSLFRTALNNNHTMLCNILKQASTILLRNCNDYNWIDNFHAINTGPLKPKIASKHRENRKTLPRELLIGCQGVKKL